MEQNDVARTVIPESVHGLLDLGKERHPGGKQDRLAFARNMAQQRDVGQIRGCDLEGRDAECIQKICTLLIERSRKKENAPPSA